MKILMDLAITLKKILVQFQLNRFSRFRKKCVLISEFILYIVDERAEKVSSMKVGQICEIVTFSVRQNGFCIFQNFILWNVAVKRMQNSHPKTVPNPANFDFPFHFPFFFGALRSWWVVKASWSPKKRTSINFDLACYDIVLDTEIVNSVKVWHIVRSLVIIRVVTQLYKR